MRKILFGVLVLLIGSGFVSINTTNDKFYTLSATVTIPPGMSAKVSIIDGMLKIDDPTKTNVPKVVETCPLWLRDDLARAFSGLLKSSDKIGESTHVASFDKDGVEYLVISGMESKTRILRLPDFADSPNLLPPTVNPSDRIAFAHVNDDAEIDLMICHKTGGCSFYLGPQFTQKADSGNVSIQADKNSILYPVSTKGKGILAGKPSGFGFWGDDGIFRKCDQKDFSIRLPNSYGAMTSLGLFLIDSHGYLRFVNKRNTAIEESSPKGFSMKSTPDFPSFDGYIHIAFDKDRILVANSLGSLTEFSITGGVWKEMEKSNGIRFGKVPSIQIYNNNLFYLNENGMITEVSTKDWTVVRNTYIFTESHFAVGDANNDGNADVAVVNDKKLTVLAGPNFNTEIFNMEPRSSSLDVNGDTSISPLPGSDLSPAFGDVNADGKLDLIVGDKDGKIALYLGPDFDKTDSFDKIDVGDTAIPQYGDVDFDGKMELLAINSDRKLLCFKLNDETWQESNSWSFIPYQSQKFTEDYYESYMHDAGLVEWNDDPETVSAYAGLLERCEKKIFDEIAFVVANTSPQVLRTMARMGQAGILERNARSIYDYAPKLPYLRLVEKDYSTTIAYKIGASEYTLPKLDYYWYVVHPKITFELPLAINCTWWDKTPGDYGLTSNDWWLKVENVFVGPTTFWREAYLSDKTYGKSVIEAASESKTYEQAIENVFLLKRLGKEGRFTFGYLTNDLYPWQIYKKGYGSCGENAIVYTSMARAALIPCYNVINQGEDHQWNEIWMPDGWRHLEPSSEDFSWDQPWVSTEDFDHSAKSVSAVYGWRGDDFAFPTTTSVTNSKPGYTTNQKGYTDTADVNFKILDADGEPVECAMVVVRTGWNNTNNLSFWGYSDFWGNARFDLGWEPYYLVDVITPYGMSGLSRLVVNEREIMVVTIRVPGKVGYRMPVYGNPSGSGTNVVISSTKDDFRPINFLTGSGMGLNGYLYDKFGFKGTLGYKQPTPATPVQFSIDGKQYQCDQDDSFGLAVGKEMIITNNSLYAWKTVKLKVDVPVDGYLLAMTAKTSKSIVKGDESFELTGTVNHSTPIKTVEVSWDSKNWNHLPLSNKDWLREFKVVLRAADAGNADSSIEKLFVRCKTLLSGCKSESIIVEVPIKVVK